MPHRHALRSSRTITKIRPSGRSEADAGAENAKMLKAGIIWITGIPASGKTTLAEAVADE